MGPNDARKRKALRLHEATPRGLKSPLCKVHLDFHNSHHVPRVAWEFDPIDFAEMLSAAEVDAIVVFAKDMHGYGYYPSALGPVHPGLNRDLLGVQVVACREKNIAVYAYYCTLWDNFLAERHPEWRAHRRDGSDYMPAEDETPGWTALCPAHPKVVALFEAHTREILRNYEVDGIWYDMPFPRDAECFCSLCLAQIEAAGLDPYDVAVQRNWQHDTHLRLLTHLWKIAQECRPGCQVDFNNQGTFRLPQRLGTMQSVDIEALPTAQWGYDYFPAVVKYARTAGAKTYGMTGRFHGSWADFGGLKEPHQLVTEAMAIVAQGALLDIGDQMPPSGKLDRAVYETIGKVFREVHRIEELIDGAAPVAECVVLTQGLPLDSVATPSVSGWIKLLTQIHIQTDVAESAWDFFAYPLVVVSADCPYDAVLAARLDTHIFEGGSVLIASEGWDLWLQKHGFGAETPVEFNPAYLIPDAKTCTIPPYEYAIYGKSWTVASAPLPLATLGIPLFQRSPQHYTSHEQSPFENPTDQVVAGCSGNVGFLGFDAGELTLRTGYWPYRTLVDEMIERLLPERMVRCDAGPNVQVEVTHQPADDHHPARFLVHLIHWNFIRPSASHPPYLVPPTKIGPVRLVIDFGRELADVTLPTGVSLTIEKPSPNIYRLTLPYLQSHETLILTCPK